CPSAIATEIVPSFSKHLRTSSCGRGGDESPLPENSARFWTASVLWRFPVKRPKPQNGRAQPHSNTLARIANASAMPPKPIITLTTDFGVKDWFVGTMKGVILAINPQAALVDITHEVAPGDVRAGAFALAASCGFFPRGTVHLAVIDPGVGSQRRAIAVE